MDTAAGIRVYIHVHVSGWWFLADGLQGSKYTVSHAFANHFSPSNPPCQAHEHSGTETLGAKLFVGSNRVGR